MHFSIRAHKNFVWCLGPIFPSWDPYSSLQFHYCQIYYSWYISSLSGYDKKVAVLLFLYHVSLETCFYCINTDLAPFVP